MNVAGKRVLVREDLNVPMDNGVVTNDARLQAALPTIKELLRQNAAVIVISHLGRPKAGEFNSEFSLEPVAKKLSDLLNKPVRFEKHWIDGVDISPGQIVLCENVRFLTGEKENDPELAKKMSALCDVFMMDAFGSAHRAHASTEGVARVAKQAVAGPLLQAELEALDKVFKNPEHPIVAIVGGSKVSTKLDVLKSLLNKVDSLIVGGGIANTFIAAEGMDVGGSLYEPDLVLLAKELIVMAKKNNKKIIIPDDFVYSEDRIFDVGSKTRAKYEAILSQAKTIIWNGPVGVFEIDPFGEGTKALAQSIVKSAAFSIAGGGDTLAAIDKYRVRDQISYISTGGGAFLEVLEGKELPAVAILKKRATEAALN